jgi:hypothetical protein
MASDVFRIVGIIGPILSALFVAAQTWRRFSGKCFTAQQDAADCATRRPTWISVAH